MYMVHVHRSRGRNRYNLQVCNVDKNVIIFQVRNWLFSKIGLANPKDESAESRRKYDFGNEVLAWRIKLRKE